MALRGFAVQVALQCGTDCVQHATCQGSICVCRLIWSSLQFVSAFTAVALNVYLPTTQQCYCPLCLELQLPAVTLPLQQLAVRLFDGELQNVGKPCMGGFSHGGSVLAAAASGVAGRMDGHALSMPAASQYMMLSARRSTCYAMQLHWPKLLAHQGPINATC